MVDLKDEFGELENKKVEQKREKKLKEKSNENIEELNAKILALESDEWYKIKQWLHEKDILDCNQQKKIGYYNFCDTLNESKRFDNPLTTGQMIKAREIYVILGESGYFGEEEEDKPKEEDVDEFFMQFMSEVKTKK